MIRFLSVSFLVLLCCSCGSLPELENFQKVTTARISVAENPYFSKTQKDHVYKAQISVYGKNLSGIFVIKRINDTLWRAALMSEFGSTLLDISYNKTYYKLNYSIPQFDKKYIVNTLVKDFRLLTIPERRVVEVYKNSENTLLKAEDDTGFVYYYVDRKNHRLWKLIKTNGRKMKVSVYFDTFEEEAPTTIHLVHHHLKLDIILNAISHAD